MCGDWTVLDFCKRDEKEEEKKRLKNRVRKDD